MRLLTTFIVAFQLLLSCTSKVDQIRFDAPLTEPCMIVNRQQDNTVEGDYLFVEDLSMGDSSIGVRLPENFYIDHPNYSHWMVGWGNNKPLYDAGVENLRTIRSIDKTNNRFFLGGIQRGAGFPVKGQRIVFWNTTPSGFSNQTKVPVIDPSMWPRFRGQSIHFSSIEFDSLLNQWVMIVNEVDEYNTDSIQIFAAVSRNLIDWQAANSGAPILTVRDFVHCSWTGKDKTRKTPQTPLVSDIVRHGNKWHLLMDGYGAEGKRSVGIAISETSLLGPYTIMEQPVLSPGGEGAWDDQAVFYAKVEKLGDGFILFYDGRSSKGVDRIGKATSKDLIHWVKSPGNPVLDQHTGWRSEKGTSAPSYIEVRRDSILLMVAGAKRFKMGPWHHYITRRMYMDKSGNVDDAQLGLYLSTDGGEHFVAHKNNPVFTNDYSNQWENEHMGGNFRLIQTDTTDFIFYQAKSSHEGEKYNILLRQKNK